MHPRKWSSCRQDDVVQPGSGSRLLVSTNLNGSRIGVCQRLACVRRR